ncbi:syntaxin-6-like [Dendronephthya gigantea]|uniref:syntaxin-6-like n=1 Tax=Dendronephthya gigantea TaxID=151771 RepID=UPI0010690894|nr:syntaxin-6-like [Dendronephthya gigantea]
MSLEDPFFVVKGEVQKSMNNLSELHEKWKSLLNNPAMVGREEYNLTTSELRNNIRSIEWDLEDLEETIQIVEGNQRKFNLGPEEIESRKNFVKQTKQNLDEVKASVNSPAAQAKVQSSNRQALVGSSSKSTSNKYSRLDQEIERSNQDFIEDQSQQQQLIMESQDDQIQLVGHSVGVLKNMSQRIGDELDEQNVLLDDLGHEVDMTDSRLQQTLQKIEKVLKLADDKKQTYVLIGLIVILVVIVVLFIAL